MVLVGCCKQTADGGGRSVGLLPSAAAPNVQKERFPSVARVVLHGPKQGVQFPLLVITVAVHKPKTLPGGQGLKRFRRFVPVTGVQQSGHLVHPAGPATVDTVDTQRHRGQRPLHHVLAAGRGVHVNDPTNGFRFGQTDHRHVPASLNAFHGPALHDGLDHVKPDLAAVQGRGSCGEEKRVCGVGCVCECVCECV